MALAEDRLEVLVACPSACLGPFDLRVGTSALLVGLARGMDPPHPDGIVSMVDVRDVATALVRLAYHPSPPRRVLLSGHDRQLHPLMVELAERYGVAAPSPPLSAQAARALADAEEHRAAAEGGRPAVSREIVDLIIEAAPLDTSLAERALGMTWRTIATTLDDYDAWARRLRFIPTQPAKEVHA
jgi:nucleoside-diphosphate-sugar epimerase